MIPSDFSDRRVTIMGLSISNLPVAQYIAQHAPRQLIITDMKAEKDLDPTLLAQYKALQGPITFILGEHRPHDFTQTDLIIKNPSIPASLAIFESAREHDIPVETDVTMFMKLCPSKNIIGVTGTKGKTTTATFIHAMLKDQGKETILAGNMGTPVMSILNTIHEDTWVVLELSSYMCESMHNHKISPHIAILTNIYPDHLNRHASFDEYAQAKTAIFAYQGNEDLTLFSSDRSLNDYITDSPGLTMRYQLNDVPDDVTLNLPGDHNRLNIAAAFAIARFFDFNHKKVCFTATNFTPLEHRMETVCIKEDISYINDSAATNPIAFIADINALVTLSKPIYLLMGGSDKNVDYREMIELVNTQHEIKKVAFFAGEASTILSNSIKEEKQVGTFDSMENAFKTLMAAVPSNQKSIVALIPGCASFGVFKNEFDRGEQFKKQVTIQCR